jgi:hypothetical protein
VQSSYGESFERDMGCSEAEWLGWMPRAIRDHDWQREGSRIVVTIGAGSLTLCWEPLPERRIALLVVKRLRVRFAFSGLDAAERLAFMKPFDLSIQRGGG